MTDELIEFPDELYTELLADPPADPAAIDSHNADFEAVVAGLGAVQAEMIQRRADALNPSSEFHRS